LEGGREIFNDDFIEAFLAELAEGRGFRYGKFNSSEFSFRFCAVKEDGICLSRVIASIQHSRFHHSVFVKSLYCKFERQVIVERTRGGCGSLWLRVRGDLRNCHAA
jgi:hypothetical protein